MNSNQSKKWLSETLKLAGIYNIVWGTLVVAFPNLLFEITGQKTPIYPMIWQSVGMVVGVYGIGYYAASKDYIRHWPIVLVGWLGKIMGPPGIIFYVGLGQLHWSFLVITFFNDIIWWIPFTLMLIQIRKHNWQ